MKVASRPLTGILAKQRDAIIGEWLAQALQTYPDQTSRFLLQHKDPFRNPVGHTLKEGFTVLFDELLGGVDASRVAAALDSIVRIRAVQDFSPSQAVSFLFLLKRIIREKTDSDAAGLKFLEDRIDEMALLAFDLFMKCREKIHEIQAGEARRRVFVQVSRDRKGAG